MFNGKARDTEVSLGATTTGITKVEIFLPNFKTSELKSVGELKQCINNLELSNSCAIVSHLPQLAIQTDASKKGWEHSTRKCHWKTMEQTGVTYTHKNFGI